MASLCHSLLPSLPLSLLPTTNSSASKRFSQPSIYASASSPTPLSPLSQPDSSLSSPSKQDKPLSLSLSLPSLPLRLTAPQPLVGRRCVVSKTTAAAAAAAMGMAALERAEARAAMAAACELAPSASGIEFCDSLVGSGVEAEKGMLIKAHYTGKLLDGTVFDSSYNRGRPLVFRIGVGEVIRGWDQGILGTTDIPAMLAGGKRTLKIPAELAYGARGAGCRGGSCVIPPNSTLIFDVEFVAKA